MEYETDPAASYDETVPVYARVPASDLAAIERYIQKVWSEAGSRLTRSDVIRMAVRKLVKELDL